MKENEQKIAVEDAKLALLYNDGSVEDQGYQVRVYHLDNKEEHAENTADLVNKETDPQKETDQKTAVKIAVHYDDGSVEELDTGLVFRINKKEDHAEITADLVNMRGNDLPLIVSAAIELGDRLHMFDDIPAEAESEVL